MSYPRQLSDEQEKQIAEEYLSGKPIRVLCEKYHMGKKLIQNAISRQGVSFRPLGTRGFSLNLPKDQRELGYIAGLLDGEGCLSWSQKPMRKNGKYPFVNIYNTNIEVIEYLQKFGGKVSWRPIREYDYGIITKRRLLPLGCWEVNGTLNIIVFLRTLMPSLIIKREKAKAMLAELEARNGNGFKHD